MNDVLAEWTSWLSAQPTAAGVLAGDDPRELVRRSLVDLANNRQRMDYPEYRRQGLPLTSTLMESLIKEMNYRVRGSEEFWNNTDGANHILAIERPPSATTTAWLQAGQGNFMSCTPPPHMASFADPRMDQRRPAAVHAILAMSCRSLTRYFPKRSTGTHGRR